MADVSSVPPLQWTPTGLVVPTQSAVLAGVQADFNAASGGNLNPDLRTPQGQVASSTAAVIADADSAFLELVNQIDPDNATGFMQDAIARIYFLNRKPAVATTVNLFCVGALGTTIPVGAQAQDTSGNIYVCIQAGTIGASGNITLPFANIVTGPLPCPANTVTTIYIQIPGWDTVNNPTSGVVGNEVESAADFEFRRQNSVAANAHGSLPSIYAAVFGVAGVIDVYATENVTGTTIVKGSTAYPLVDHSLYVAVVGGTATDIAQAIWTKKDLGCNMNGNTTEVVTDESGYSFPFPTYNITFNRPTSTTINFIVNIVNSTSLPSTIVVDVQNAVAAQFNGQSGIAQSNGIIPATSGQRARIGALLLAASYYGPVATCEGPSVPVQVLSIFLGSTFSGQGTLINTSNVLTITTASTGSLSVGTVVSGTNIVAGTTIVQQLTGTPGGVGSYQMSSSATGTVGTPEAIIGAGGTAQQLGIDQDPVLGTVVVNLV